MNLPPAYKFRKPFTTYFLQWGPKLFLLLVCYGNLSAQEQVLALKRSDELVLQHPDGSQYRFPWTGGFNYCQSGMIDLNQDGLKDLVIFDRSGDRVIPFVYLGPEGTTLYKHDFRYAYKFPEIKEFMILYDFDCDGRNDLFTYGDGGIRVYRNTSSATQGLQFEPYAVQLSSGLISIFILPVDFPAVADIDHDGDTDLLVFGFSGTCIEYHRNMAKELYNRCDTLVLRFESDNWGEFTEDFSSNSITLNDSCDNPGGRYRESRHAGSSLLVTDLDGDLDMDLILGDITYPTLLKLTNGGNLQKARITAQQADFPEGTRAINLQQFPTASLIDFDHDGKQDLLVGANSKSNSENYHCIWYYQNTGTATIPTYVYKTDTLLVDETPDMGQGSIPVVFDYNNDGLPDLIVGNEGYSTISGLKSALALFENTGSGFRLISRDYAGLSGLQTNVRYFHPAFIDLDFDGDKDMLVGCSDGRFVEYENTAIPGQQASFQFKSPAYEQIDVGTYAAPFVYDIDGDGIDDIISGNGEGKFWYFRMLENNGKLKPELISNFWGGISTANLNQPQGFSRPVLFNKDGVLFLLSGTSAGAFQLYRIQESIPSEMIDSTFLAGETGEKSAICLLDLNNDGLLDAITGNQAGGLCYFQGLIPNHLASLPDKEPIFSISPNPGSGYISIIPTIMGASPGELIVFSISGIEVYRQHFPAQGMHIDTGSWAPGMYIFRLKNQKTSATVRWVRY